MKALRLEINALSFFYSRLFGQLTQRAYYSRFAGLKIKDIAEPELPGDDWVKVKTRMGGICASDVAVVCFRRGYDTFFTAFTSMPLVLGHENVAEIIQVGSDVNGFKVGDRVNVDAVLSCIPRGIDPPCRECRDGNPNICLNFAEGEIPPGNIIGSNGFTGGSWSEYFVAHRSQLYKVPDSVPDEHAVLVDPLSCSLRTVLKHKPADDEKVVVIGGGIIGLGVVAWIRALGSKATVIVIAKYGFQREHALRLGADYALRPAKEDLVYKIGDLLDRKVYHSRYGFNAFFTDGVDAVYDCVGNSSSLNAGLKFLKERGSCVVVGMGWPEVFDWTPFWFRELNLMGVYNHGIEEWEGGRKASFEIVHEALASGRLDPSGFLTHRYPLNEYQKAFDSIFKKGSTGQIKTAFTYP